MGEDGGKRSSCQAKSPIECVRQNAQRRTKEKEQQLELFIPAGPRLGDVVIEAKNVSKGFGNKLLYENLSFALPKGGIVGIIGPNGAGKTTLFRMMMGMEQPDSGEFKIGETVKTAYVDQSHEDLLPENRFLR